MAYISKKVQIQGWKEREERKEERKGERERYVTKERDNSIDPYPGTRQDMDSDPRGYNQDMYLNKSEVCANLLNCIN